MCLGAISLKLPNFLTTSQDVIKGADQAKFHEKKLYLIIIFIISFLDAFGLFFKMLGHGAENNIKNKRSNRQFVTISRGKKSYLKNEIPDHNFDQLFHGRFIQTTYPENFNTSRKKL